MDQASINYSPFLWLEYYMLWDLQPLSQTTAVNSSYNRQGQNSLPTH